MHIHHMPNCNKMRFCVILCTILEIVTVHNHVYGYVYYPDGEISYKFHHVPQTWFNAVLICNTEDATLAMPSSKYEANILKSIFEEYINASINVDSDYFHLGFHGIYNEYEYTTIQDESLDEVYHQWANNRPADVSTLKCGAMHCSGGLSNICCYRLKGFICEKRDENYETQFLNKYYSSDKGYTYADGLLKSYKLHMSPRIWTDARAVCHAEGGYLAIIRRKEEKDFIQAMLSDPEYSTPMTNDRYYHAFIGLHDQFREKHFTTVFGEDMLTKTYVEWSPGEPNGRNKENCVGIKMTGGLNDYQCNRPAVFVCERLTPQYSNNLNYTD